MAFRVGEKPQTTSRVYPLGFVLAWSQSCTDIPVPTQTPTGLFIENRAETTATLAAQLSRNRYVGQLRTISASELRAMIDRILDYYGEWSAGNGRGLESCIDFLENVCFALSIPLAETAYALYVLRDGISDLLAAGEHENREQGRDVNCFFEALVRDLLRRY